MLGLARALRDARASTPAIVAPCDGPPPEPGITTVGPSTRVPSNGSVAPIAAGQRGRAPHARGDPHVRARRRAPARAARRRAPTTPRWSAPRSRRSAPSTAARAGRNPLVPDASGRRCGRCSRRAHGPRPRCPSEARAPGRADVRRPSARSCRTASTSMRFAKADPWPPARPAILFVGRHEPRKGLWRAARRVRAARPRRRPLGRGRRPETDELREPRRRRRSSGSGASPTTRRRAGSGARRSRASRRSTVSRSASCCSRRWPRGTARGRVRHRRLPQRRPPRRRGAARRRPATPTRCAHALRRVLDDDARRAELIAAGRAPRRRVLDDAARRAVRRRSTSGRSPTTPGCTGPVSPEARPAELDALALDGRGRDPRRRRPAARHRRRPRARRARARAATRRCDRRGRRAGARAAPARPRATSASTPRTAGSSPTAGRAPSSWSTRSTAPAPRPRASSRAACRSRSCRRREDATARRGVVRRRPRAQDRRSGSSARRGGGARGGDARRDADPDRAVGQHRPRRAVLDRRAARPPVAADERSCSRSSSTGRSMGGGYFDLGSAAFNLTRLVTGQLDAYVDVGRRIVDEVPATEAAFLRVGEGAVCTNFPYDVAAAALDRAGGGWCGHPRRRPPARRPSRGRLVPRARAWRCSAAASRELHATAARRRRPGNSRGWRSRERAGS